MKTNKKERTIETCGGIPMPKSEITELVFILDRSGSMSGFEGDTIGGFNAMIEKQKEKESLAISKREMTYHIQEIIKIL